MTQLVVHGSNGRMGLRICALANDDKRFTVIGTVDRSASSDEYKRNIESSSASIDVVIDFSSDEGARNAARIADETGAALLVGTTGLSSKTLDVLDESARSRAVMIAPNTSRGVAVLNALLQQAAQLLGPAYEIDLTDEHHRFKRDAPSGTALRLLETINRARGEDLPSDRVHCIRSGDIIGDHKIQFAGRGERVQLVHSAVSRDLFALGALDAAGWLAGKPAGRYTIEDALGLSVKAADGSSRVAQDNPRQR